MDILQELWDLYESEMNVVSKPQFEPEEDTFVQEPGVDPELNFRAQQSKAIAKLRQKGKGVSSGGNAYELIKGPIDTGDPYAVADLAAHMKANELDTSQAPKVDPDSISLFAQDEKQRKAENLPDDGDLHRPADMEISDDQEKMNVADDESGRLNNMEEMQYNDDVIYLRTFGRA